MRIDEPQWPVGDYTYAAWVLPRQVREWRAVLEIQTPNSRGLEFAIDGSSQAELWSAGARLLRSGIQLRAGRWTHVALTRSSHLLTFHVDGIAGGVARDGTVFNFGSCPALVGVDADSGCTGKLNGFFDGVIDELRVYDCALSGDGIRSIMATAVDPSANPAVGVEGGPAPSQRDGLLGSPPRWDLALVARLAQTLGRWPAFDIFVQGAGSNDIFGGIWYAAASLHPLGSRSATRPRNPSPSDVDPGVRLLGRHRVDVPRGTHGFVAAAKHAPGVGRSLSSGFPSQPQPLFVPQPVHGPLRSRQRWTLRNRQASGHTRLDCRRTARCAAADVSWGSLSDRRCGGAPVGNWRLLDRRSIATTRCALVRAVVRSAW